VSLGGHVAEKLLIGAGKVSSGCGSDLKGATDIAYRAVR
jgi:ATP-dependent Zn protease